MLLKRIYDEDLAQASYLVGCQAEGVAAVVDPRRDIGVYLEEAERNDLRIVAVTETHIHADYLSGARELAVATGASLYLSDEGGADWQYRYEHEGLRDGTEIRLGRVVLRALHTPGHTPEHLSFLVTDGAASAEPGFILTGDFVFVGDLGRPDLLDEAAGEIDTRGPMARRLFRSLVERFLDLPDWIQVLPGHGAGSACGKALGSAPSTTVGYEKLTAWWARFARNRDEAGFVAELLRGQPDAPIYFGRMKRQNRAGPALVGVRDRPRRLEGGELRRLLDAGALLVDTRPRAAYSLSAVPASLHLPAGTSFANRAAWSIDPEREKRELVLLASDRPQAEELRAKLARVGIDDVGGYVTDLSGLEARPVPSVSPDRIDTLVDPLLLDVRNRSEYEAGHLPGAMHLSGGRLLWHLDEIPEDGAVVVYCQSGARSAVAASILRSLGYSNVLELDGGYEGWRGAEQAVSDAVNS